MNLNNIYFTYNDFVSNHSSMKNFFGNIVHKNFDNFCNTLFDEQGKLTNLVVIVSKQQTNVAKGKQIKILRGAIVVLKNTPNPKHNQIK